MFIKITNNYLFEIYYERYDQKNDLKAATTFVRNDIQSVTFDNKY